MLSFVLNFPQPVWTAPTRHDQQETSLLSFQTILFFYYEFNHVKKDSVPQGGSD